MKKRLLSRKAEGYIDVCVGIIVLLSVLVLTLNIYSFLTLKQDLDEITEQLVEVATTTGCFGDEFNDRVEAMKSQFFDFNVTVSADSWYNASYKRVQLGKTMKVTISVQTKLLGLGVVEIPITATSTRSGLSQHYWKG
ncbi:MAG: DUF4320 family protein [Clostridia bacterium]|nr:DUF4320 family protein [Clostridia bacterium]